MRGKGPRITKLVSPLPRIRTSNWQLPRNICLASTSSVFPIALQLKALRHAQKMLEVCGLCAHRRAEAQQHPALGRHQVPLLYDMPVGHRFSSIILGTFSFKPCVIEWTEWCAEKNFGGGQYTIGTGDKDSEPGCICMRREGWWSGRDGWY